MSLKLKVMRDWRRFIKLIFYFLYLIYNSASRPNISTVHLTKLEDGQSSSPLDESDETDSVESENTWSDFLEIGEDRFRTDPRIPYWFLCRKFDVVKSPTGPGRVLPAFGKVVSFSNLY